MSPENYPTKLVVGMLASLNLHSGSDGYNEQEWIIQKISEYSDLDICLDQQVISTNQVGPRIQDIWHNNLAHAKWGLHVYINQRPSTLPGIPMDTAP
jgi:hypothetical protein